MLDKTTKQLSLDFSSTEDDMLKQKRYKMYFDFNKNYDNKSNLKMRVKLIQLHGVITPYPQTKKYFNS